jgi:hypothetical protein
MPEEKPLIRRIGEDVPSSEVEVEHPTSIDIPDCMLPTDESDLGEVEVAIRFVRPVAFSLGSLFTLHAKEASFSGPIKAFREDYTDSEHPLPGLHVYVLTLDPLKKVLP